MGMCGRYLHLSEVQIWPSAPHHCFGISPSARIVDMIRAGSAEGVFRSRNLSLGKQREDFGRFAFENRPVGYQMLVYQIEGTTVGYVDYQVRRGLGRVLGIYVKPSHRRMGIGMRLMKKALDDFQGKGCHKARLSVLAVNHGAINFYKHLGFVQEGFLRKDEEKKDTVIMSKFLPQVMRN